jgi:hypothetical protein
LQARQPPPARERGDLMPRERQIEFPPEQSHHRLVTPVMLLVSLVFIVAVIIILVTDLKGPFIGPWG